MNKQVLKKQGFTFIELMIVLGLLMTIVGLSFPALQKTFYSLNLSNFSNDLASLMTWTRETAVRNNVSYELHIDLSKGKVSVVSITDSEKKLVRTLYIPDRIKLKIESPVLYFYPNGSLTSTNIHITDMTGSLPESYDILTQYATGGIFIHEKI